MRAYEIMYIIRPNIEDEAKKTLVENFDRILTDHGAEIIESKEWGKRRLAYEINDYRDGIYHIIKTKSNPEAVEEFSRLARINDDIIRHIVIRDEK